MVCRFTVVAAVALASALPLGVGCSFASLIGGPIDCTDDAACPTTAPYCIEFQCARAPAGEGEGDVVVGEGEGDIVVGEGEGDVVVGEGEGDVVVGEGEGDIVVGEGEGDIVVGEGEGEGDAFAGCEYVVVSDADNPDARSDGVCADASGVCTFRAAITEANAGTGGPRVCLAIDVGGGVTVVNSSYTLDGKGHSISGGDPVITVDGDSSFGLENISVIAGRSTTGAAGLRVFGRVTIDDALFEDNVVTADADSVEGGAIGVFDGATLVVERTNFVGNRVDAVNSGFARGGAIAAFGGSKLFISEVGFFDNAAAHVGGALFLATSLVDVTIERSTFGGNSADAGSSIDFNCAASGRLEIQNSTFAANNGAGVAFLCGGHTAAFRHCSFLNNPGPLVLFNDDAASTIAGVEFGNCAIDHAGDTLCAIAAGHGLHQSLGGNVSNADDSACELNAANDQFGDARFGEFGDHGGFAATLPLGTFSDARDAGDPNMCLEVDERGVARDDGACDAGAFEAR